jgi:NADH pyrophosphatase NudC (nudix superfamily)
MTPNNQNFNFCPECGKKATVVYKNSRHWVCSECGFDVYNNIAAAVGVIVTDGDGKVLFAKRAKEPKKGLCGLPGGFADPGETGEDAALRECREETNLRPKSLRYLCSFPNSYEFKSVMYSTCDMFFLAEFERGFDIRASLKAEEAEVSELVFYPVESREDIEKIPIAFVSHRTALEVYVAGLQGTFGINNGIGKRK